MSAVNARHRTADPGRKLLYRNRSAHSASPAEQFLIGAAAIGNTCLSSELDALFALDAAYSDILLLEALTPAVAFKRFRAADVRSILATGAAAPTPRSPGDALIVDLPSAPIRSLQAYKHTPATDSKASS